MNTNKTINLEVDINKDWSEGNEMGEWAFVTQPVRKSIRDDNLDEFVSQVKDDTSDSLNSNVFTTESCDLLDYEEDYFTRPAEYSIIATALMI